MTVAVARSSCSKGWIGVERRRCLPGYYPSCKSKGSPSSRGAYPDKTTSVDGVISSYLANSSEVDDHTVHLLFSANRWEKRSTYSDLCLQIPKSKFRRCLLHALNLLFKLMSSYYEFSA